MNPRLFPLALSLLWLAGCATPPAPPPARTAPDRAAAAPPAAAKTVAPTFLPRVMVIVDEKSLGTIATAEVEAMAIKKLLAMNVPVVDQDMVRANVARSQQMLVAAGDNRGAAALGAQFGADVVLIGEAVAKPSARRIGDTNLRSYQAVATLRAVRTDNSATLAAASEDVTQVGLEDVSGSAKALRGAGEKALDALIPEMLAKWTPGNVAGAAAKGALDAGLAVASTTPIAASCAGLRARGFAAKEGVVAAARARQATRLVRMAGMESSWLAPPVAPPA